MGVRTGLWQPLRLDLRSPLLDTPWVPMQKLTELKINLSQTQLQESSLIYFSSTQPRVAYHPGFMWELSVIDCCSLDFQGLTRRMHEGTGMLSWPPRPLINAVYCWFVPLCRRPLREVVEHTVLSSLIKTEQEKIHSNSSSRKQWRSDLDCRNTASNPPQCSDNLYCSYHRCFQ